MLAIACRAVALGCVVAAAAGCPPSVQLPAPTCPGVTLPGDPLGSASPSAGKSSIVLAARGSYVAALINQQLAQRAPADPSATSGADLGAIALTQTTAGSERRNFLTIQFSAWLRGADGAHVPLPERVYTLRLRLLPHLLTAATSAAAVRQQYLGCAAGDPCSVGVVVSIGFDALLGGGVRAADQAVDCTAPSYDLIDGQVLAASMQAAASIAPMGLALDAELAALATQLGISPHVTGIDLGTDHDLVVGFLLDAGSPPAFISSAIDLNVAGGDVDWTLELDPQLLIPAIRTKVNNVLGGYSNVKLGSPPAVQFTASGIQISLAGKASESICGDVPFTITATAALGVCNHAIGTCPSIPSPTISPASDAQRVCIAAGTLVQQAEDMLKSIVHKSTVPSDTASCTAITSATTYPVGSRDVVYPLRIDTTSTLLIAGRSVVMDSAHPERPAAQTTGCQW